MPSRETFAYRRALKLRAQKAVDDSDTAIDSIFTRAQDDFLTFCTIMDKAPAHHMLEWHKHLITGVSNRYLLDIAGPNLDILAPRGSAKSTVLNMFTAWIIGRHTSKGMPLQIIYCSSTSPQLFRKVESSSRSSTRLRSRRSFQKSN